MTTDRLLPYVPMWTTDIHRYGLLEVAPGALVAHLVFDLEAMAPLTIDDDDEVVAAVIDNMRRAGVRVLRRDETVR